MSDETRQDQQTGRRITVGVYGGGADTLELAALDEARKFFGTEARLEVQRSYHVHAYTLHSPDERYHANITVCEL